MKCYAVTLTDKTNLLVVANTLSECFDFLVKREADVANMQPILAEVYVVESSDKKQ